jgi:predicted membrane protein
MVEFGPEEAARIYHVVFEVMHILFFQKLLLSIVQIQLSTWTAALYLHFYSYCAMLGIWLSYRFRDAHTALLMFSHDGLQVLNTSGYSLVSYWC